MQKNTKSINLLLSFAQLENIQKLESLADENPDLSIDLISDILISKEEIKNLNLSEYLFG